jgi:penicillin V acylase-like amidase (Ntn superfamily)
VCTRALWPDAAGSVLVGRNMDWPGDPLTNLWALPRGIERSDGVDDQLSWTARYGSVVASAYDLMTIDGMNEAGLAAHQLYLLEADYGPLEPGRTTLSVAVWLQCLLDRFATVSEAVAWVEEVDLRIAPQANPLTSEVVTVHLALEDATGDSAIIEYLEGTAHIYHGRSYRVLTNTLVEEQLARFHRDESGEQSAPLLGTTDSLERSARAAYYLSRLPSPRSHDEAIASMLSVIRNAAQPFRVPDPDKPFASSTVWGTVSDLTDRTYYFDSPMRPGIVWARLDSIDLSEEAPSAKVDLVRDAGFSTSLVGDVTDRFVPTEPLRFFSVAEGEQLGADIIPASAAFRGTS